MTKARQKLLVVLFYVSHVRISRICEESHW